MSAAMGEKCSDLKATFDNLILLPKSPKDISTAVTCLIKGGCCSRCVLRFLGEKEPSTYRRSPQETFLLVQNLLNASEIDKQNGHDDGETLKQPEAQISTPCTACLGVLAEYCEDDFLLQVKQKIESQDFQFENFCSAISLPVPFLVREHSIMVLLRETLPLVYLPVLPEHITPLKDVWKWISGHRLAEMLGKSFEQKSPFEIAIFFTHPEVEKECNFLLDLFPEVYRKRKTNKHGWELFTRMSVAKSLNSLRDVTFKKNSQCPPKPVSVPCTCEAVRGTHTAIFLAGRYNKFSRHLSQTPWVIEGERKMESSVQELIGTLIQEKIKADDVIFSASGREDVDVRMLGRGRPFVLEVVNPHARAFTQDDLAAWQEDINKKTKDIAIRDLQLVSREETNKLKEGEMEKVKSYCALCWSHQPFTSKHQEKIAAVKDLKLFQKTPIRVLHRRALAVRERVIHSMSSEKVDDCHFKLYLSTQAGTYIKEFVHGDFGRTTPNLTTLLEMECDILELDVEAVELDWPPNLGDPT
ncbi:putative tRNA pseudouridine synthase Pus10 [Lingula anatina]|uniref:tRNA pseudouridine(55) synthase n=1 Tax=Lingula anatina TaxID=7574 RepID=A0A1S3I093_LINAN|nr:putative tRNA pseudouridine synthase Pus10 [Lingula anatina]|eukprot:XP_013391682.1 putative tRNA pseudouridine synthase Pus10 [Lingula anatina]